MLNRHKYEAWIGSFADSYFGNLDKGTWKKISGIRYWFLNTRGYIVRKTKI